MLVVYDSDDIMEINPVPIKELEQLNAHFDNFKVTLMVVPGSMPTLIEKPYIEYGVHGHTHEGIECREWTEADLDYLSFLNYDVFVKVFRAPRWQISDEAVEGLIKRGFIVCLHPDRVCKVVELPFIYKSRKDPDQWKDDGTPQLLHGHISSDQRNGIKNVLYDILQMPKDTEFKFITEYMK